MQVEFLSQFNKDLDKIRFANIKQSVQRVILRVESAQNLSEIPNIKKLSGHKSAYRIRIGDYRIGILWKGKLFNLLVLFIEKTFISYSRNAICIAANGQGIKAVII